MKDQLNKMLEDLADISYTTLDVKEDILSRQFNDCDTLKKLDLIHQVLNKNQRILIELTK